MVERPLSTQDVSPNALLDAADVVLCDIDGCLISGEVVLPGARDLLQLCGHKLRLLSNNSTDSSQSLATRLGGLGLKVQPSQCVLAGEVAVRTLAAKWPGARVCVLASSEITALCVENGLHVTTRDPDVVLICRDTSLTFDRLQVAVTAASRSVPIVLANRDLSHPGIAAPAIETGAIYALVRSIVDPKLLMEIGKPVPLLYEAALAGIPAHHAVMIGDNPDTDLAGAEGLSMPCLLIGSAAQARAPDLRTLLSAPS